MDFPGKRMLESARKEAVALGGFDTFNMESAQAVVNAANELSTPLFLQVCIKSAEYMDLDMAGKILLEAKRKARVDICVHLDHGPEVSNIEQLRQAIEMGFESVMVDGSSLSLEENIALSRKVVQMAHPQGVCVEGELGGVSRNINATREEIAQLMTDPDKAAYFAEKSGVDYLAISVGSVSGFFKGKVNLDFERLAKIRDKVEVPLVFHGGTGIPPDQLKQAISLGVCKVNIAHGLRKAFLDGMSAYLDANPEEINPRKVLGEAGTQAKEFMKNKLKEITGIPRKNK